MNFLCEKTFTFTHKKLKVFDILPTFFCEKELDPFINYL